MFSFLEFALVRMTNSEMEARIAYRAAVFPLEKMSEEGQSREAINAAYYRIYQGWSCSDTDRLAAEWFRMLVKVPENFLSQPIQRLQRHRVDGCRPVLVSGSFTELLLPFADWLGGAEVLATRLERRAGAYTGAILAPQMIGQGKAEAVRHYIAANCLNPDQCHAYGDHISDLPMLVCVGHPVVITGDPRLEQAAVQNKWEIITVQSNVIEVVK
jgi:HAD superfamily hydrolase (TIGR01490 family)